jgi:ABC-2 type transport system permease protein
MKLLAILEKEWLELRHQRSLILGTIIPPLLMALLPLGIMFGLRETPDEDTASLGIVLADPMLAGMSTAELGQAVLGKQFALLILMMPVVLSGIIAAYSIVGEKNGRTLEPVLATPVRTWELLLAKCLTALLPALAATWCAALLFAVGTRAVSLSDRVVAAVLSPGWLVTILLCSPSLAMLSIAGCVAVSSRVNDPRTAQQLGALAIIPIMGLFFAQMAGAIVLSAPLAIGAALALALLAAGALWAATRLFQREAILTRWK